MVRKLNILLIEDSESESEAIKEYASTTNDINIVAVTNSSHKGIEYVKGFLPDAVILDLELHAGDGNGIHFLDALNQLTLPCYPYVLVTTHNVNPITHAKVRKSGAGFILTKNQEDYSARNVIEFLRDMKDFIKSSKRINNVLLNLSTIETPEEFSKRVSQLINKELDLIGLNPKMKGRSYLKEGIQIIILESPKTSICSLLAQRHEKTDPSVDRAMQHVINRAWRNMAIEDLSKHYTAYINPRRGVPTNTELMYHYAEKIKNKI